MYVTRNQYASSGWSETKRRSRVVQDHSMSGGTDVRTQYFGRTYQTSGTVGCVECYHVNFDKLDIFPYSWHAYGWISRLRNTYLWIKCPSDAEFLSSIGLPIPIDHLQKIYPEDKLEKQMYATTSSNFEQQNRSTMRALCWRVLLAWILSLDKSDDFGIFLGPIQ